jgi:hypothetical protein
MTSILLFRRFSPAWGVFQTTCRSSRSRSGTSWRQANDGRSRDYEAPLYNADIEDSDGIPQGVLDFRRLVATHDALCLATPEYNGGMTPILLNMFCWASRPSPTDDFGAVFQGKPVALMASSPGRLGGVRVIPRLRDAGMRTWHGAGAGLCQHWQCCAGIFRQWRAER